MTAALLAAVLLLAGISCLLLASVLRNRQRVVALGVQLAASKETAARLRVDLAAALQLVEELQETRDHVAQIVADDPYELDTDAQRFAAVLRSYNEPAVVPPHEQDGPR